MHIHIHLATWHNFQPQTTATLNVINGNGGAELKKLPQQGMVAFTWGNCEIKKLFIEIKTDVCQAGIAGANRMRCSR